MRLFIAVFISCFTLFSPAQTITPDIHNPLAERIEQALKQGSSKEIAKILDATVEIKLGDNRGNFSKNQAEIILRDFFKKHPPQNFEIIHQSESTETISYLIGNYLSTAGTFKTLIKSKPNSASQLRIYSLEITKE
ncbi:MAG: DUF4783 domain-containing protein [Lunatimonas sp.]|uniref:DUF4783 domain-containing protein n=1 Tax=Lunatimonas sp. TaxID=2060141 RepID=UPI00263AC807|nr:DUF4783 domain-containing protein [Lunatimonas sp.]MCC5938428.1 DUF4783 domain-containing protein [Lunatimonas sp.]